MRDTELLLKLENDIVGSRDRRNESLAQKKAAREKIRKARQGTNENSIRKAELKLEEVKDKPAEAKQELKKYRENLREIMTSKPSKAELGYAKQEVKDAKLRIKTAKKEYRQAKAALYYCKHVGDSDAIVAAQGEINNIKLDLIRDNLTNERVICDAKAYIKKQQSIIKENESLVKANDENATKEVNEAKEEISKAHEIIKKAKKNLPLFSGFKKYYNEHLDAFEAAILLAPAMILLILFMIFPLINTGIMAFLEDFRFVDGKGLFAINHSYTGIGFGEFLGVLKDPVFIQALKNTTIMVIVSVPITVIIALFISVALNGVKKLQGMYQTIFFLPYVTNTIALGMVFKVLFATNGGLINTIFNCNVEWMKHYWTSLVVLTVYTVWNGLAFKILIFLSGLQSIDKQYYDAALIDGASKNRIFRKITVPLLSPMILYTVITSFIGAFKAYSSVIAVFGRGKGVYGPPGNPKMWITVVGYIYDAMSGKITAKGTLSQASAGAVILLLIILLITIVQFAVSKKKVHY